MLTALRFLTHWLWLALFLCASPPAARAIFSEGRLSPEASIFPKQQSGNTAAVTNAAAGAYPRTVETEADGITVGTVFDRMGRPRFVSDRRGKTFEFRYDALGRRTQVITPRAQATVTTYTHNGRVNTVSEPSGDTATFGYSGATGRLSSVAYAGALGGTVNFTSYDSNGNVLALDENGAGGIARTYDSLNRLTSRTYAGQTVGYRYYASGKLAMIIYPGGSETGTGRVDYTYWPDGRLMDVVDRLDSASSPRTTRYTWRTDGRLQSIARPNGTLRSISYEPATGRPQTITESLGATVLLSWTVGYYASDDIASLSVTPPVPPGSLAAVPSAAMTFDDDNRVATYNGQAVVHDADGNLTSGPLPVTGVFGAYVYDSRNRLRSAGGLTYSYDAEGNRTGITGTETTTFTVDAQAALSRVLVRVKNGVTTRYVHGAGLQYEVNAGGQATYYHYDPTANTAALTNASGTIIERVAYSPYGGIRYRQSNFDTPFLYGGFFGVLTDSNGLIAMRARYYNPLLMRFLTGDPARDGLNWYAYAGGNPLAFADPSGFGATNVLDAVQLGLTVLGFVPGGIGTVANLVNAGISLARDDPGAALGHLAAAVPGLGGILAESRAVISTVRSAAQIEQVFVRAESAVVGGAVEGTTPLYRAVMNSELKDIAGSGVFRNPAGIENKYFSTTAEGAADYAKKAFGKFGDTSPYTIIRTDAPTSIVPKVVPVDGGVPAVVIPTKALPRLSPPQILPYSPVPR